MAGKKPSQTAISIQKLLPHSIEMKIDGRDVRVATDKYENAVLNMIMAAQGRTLIQEALKKWKDMDETPSPKELRDIAGAMRDLAAFSAEIYNTTEPIADKETSPTKPADTAEDLDFSKITSKPIEVDANNAETPKAGEEAPVEELSGEDPKLP